MTRNGSDQTALMRRLILGFASRTYHIVGNLMHRLSTGLKHRKLFIYFAKHFLDFIDDTMICIISHYKKIIGYYISVLQQIACLVVNPITVGNFASLFNCTPVGQTSYSMMVPT